MTLLIGLRLIQGAAGAAGIVVGRAVIADLFTGKAAAAFFSAVASVNGMAPILAPVIGGQILRVGTWRTVFWVLAGIGVVLLVLAALVIRESLPPDRRSGGGLAATMAAFGTLARDRGYVGCVLAGSMVTAAMFGYISASPFLLQDRFGLSAQWFSACFALNALGIIGATQLGRLLLRRISSLALLTVGVVQALVGAVLLAVTVFAGVGPGDGADRVVRHGVRGGFALPQRVGDRDGPAPPDRRVRVRAAGFDPVRVRRGHRAAGRPGGSGVGGGAGSHRAGGHRTRRPGPTGRTVGARSGVGAGPGGRDGLTDRARSGAAVANSCAAGHSGTAVRPLRLDERTPARIAGLRFLQVLP